MESHQERRQRFKRSHDQVRLTPDDLAIIDQLRQHRFLRSTHLIRLFPHRPPKKLIERLGALFHAGYLDRPRVQLDYYARAGSSPMVYGLGDRSHALAAECADLKWVTKHHDVKRPYIEHALSVADVMVALEIAARAREDLEFVAAEQLLSLKPRPDQSHPWKLSADLVVGRERHAVTLIPDAVFALRSRSTGRHACFFIESDRGTMPIERADFAQTSIRRKLLAYQAALRARQHVERFAFHNLRILTVTTGADRIQSMIAALNAVTHGIVTGRFLFAEHPAVTGVDPLSLLWTTNGEPVRIDAPLRATLRI
jgi:hypothetical protein